METILNNLTHLDLLSVGIAVAATTVIGFIIFFNNPKSITNQSFLLFALAANLYGILNYVSYQPRSDAAVLWILRLVIFSAVWYAYSLFQLLYTIPEENITFPNWYKHILFPAVFLISILDLTPLVFSGLSSTAVTGEVAKVTIGPGLPLFVSLASFLVLGSLFVLIKKTIKAKGLLKRQLGLILIGSIITYLLIIIFNMLLPTIFQNVQFVKLAPVFAFPFIIFTSYTIFRYNLMNIKVISAEVLVFVLSIITFFEIVIANSVPLTIYRSCVFLAVLGFGLLLIRSVVKEVAQREKIEKLAGDLALTNNQLKFANDKLKELDKQKTEFVSIASHQLRSPLTAIKGYSSMLLEGSFGQLEEKAKGAVDRIFESSLREMTVIEDFLNITRIELGKMKYELSVFDLGVLASGVVKDQEPNVKKRGLTIEFQDGSGIHQISADSGKATQVVSNIIDNAIKYTPAQNEGQNGWIKVKVENTPTGKSKTKETVRLTVSDNGVGIEKGTLPKLFEKFVRADDAGKTNITGTGLGLYVAKQIVEGLGGKIWAESEGKGKGSSFIVEFPRSSGEATVTDHKIEAYTQADLKSLKKK